MVGDFAHQQFHGAPGIVSRTEGNFRNENMACFPQPGGESSLLALKDLQVTAVDVHRAVGEQQ